MRKFPSLCISSIILVFVTACASRPADSTAQPLDLIPYATSTRVPLRAPEGLIPLTTPLPTSTPFTYIVQAGDTMSQIAERFDVSLEDLQAANPDVSSNAMSVGQVINIPSNPGSPSGVPTQTPAPFTVEQIECYPTVDRGMWCFILARNDLPDVLENLSAQVTLVDAGGAIAAAQTAFLPLDILPPGSSLPLAVFFTPDIPLEAKPRVQILTAIRLPAGDDRYLRVSVNNTLVEVNAGGHSARVRGLVLSHSPSSAASRVWVAATAYDEYGRVVGVRKWVSNAGLPAGGTLPFDFLVSSVGGRIARVEFAVQARP